MPDIEALEIELKNTTLELGSLASRIKWQEQQIKILEARKEILESLITTAKEDFKTNHLRN
ncbi:MAG: hypothetical protein ACRBFS_24325 [Aureispira sp.]